MAISLNTFASFVNTAQPKGMGQRVILSGKDSSPIGIGPADLPDMRQRNIYVGGRPVTCQAYQNNEVRQALLDALMSNYNAKTVLQLPKGVLKALRVGGLLRDDMMLTKDARVTSGRPLTLRRIKAVLTAVQKAGLSSENKAFNREFSGCSAYHLFDSQPGVSRMPFKTQVNAYYGAAQAGTLPNFFKMLADAASFLTKSGDKKMTSGSYSMNDLNKAVSRLEKDVGETRYSAMIFGMRNLIQNGYAKWTETSRREAIASLMSGEAAKDNLDPDALNKLRNMLRYGDSQGRPESMTDQALTAQLTKTRTELETAWRKADSMGASLEQKLANDMLRYVIDNWLKDEVKG